MAALNRGSLTALDSDPPSGAGSAERSALPGASSEPAAQTAWQPPIEAQGHHLALLATRKLKEISLYLLIFAVLLPTLAIGAGVMLAVWGDLPGVWGPFAFVAGAFVGLLSFLFFKFMSDTVRALADLSDLARGLEVQMSFMSEALERQSDAIGERS